MTDPLDIALEQASRVSSDGVKPTFSVVIEDPERGRYGVNVERYIDADRAGFCGYVTDEVYTDLDQVTASEFTRKLNGFVEERYARRG